MTQKLYIYLLIFILSILKLHAQDYPITRADSALIQSYEERFKKEIKIPVHAREATEQLNKAAELYRNYEHYDKAIEYYKKSLDINTNILHSENAISMINTELANIYTDKGDYKTAIEYFNKTLKARRINNDGENLIHALINISVVYTKAGDYDNSVKHLNEALDLARQANNPKLQRSCYGLLAETYEKSGNQEKALYYYEYYKTFNNYVTEERVKKTKLELEKERLQKELAQKMELLKTMQLQKTEDTLAQTKKEVIALNEKEKELLKNLSKAEMSIRIIEQDKKIAEYKNEQLEAQKRRRTNALIFVSILLLIIALSAVFLLRLYRDKKAANEMLVSKNIEINQQKEEIETQRDELDGVNKIIAHKNKLITDSISYAKMIQDAMIDRNGSLAEIIPNSFVFFKPRDIVSGDFYWYDKIDDNVFVIAADCTGHGVPGAFLTFIGHNLLNQVIVHEKVTDPATILKRLDEGIAEALNQTRTDNTDGMDIALCIYNIKKREMKFAGAKNPLFIIKNGEFEEIQGDKSSIGGFEIRRRGVQKGFTTKSVQVENGSWFYIFSDGIVDQFDRKSKRKYSKQRLRNVLLKAASENPERQKELIIEDFNKWKGSDKQTDDILIIGFNTDSYHQ